MAASYGALSQLPQAEKQNVSAEKGEDKTQAKNDTAKPSAPVNVTVSSDLQFKSADQQAHGQKEAFYQSSEWWLVAATVILVIVTARLVVFTKKLWGATNDLVIDAKKTSVRQAGEMETSLGIARDAADAATKQVKSAVNVERPFVYARSISCSREKSADFSRIPQSEWHNFPEHYNVGVAFTNYGRTPAFVIGAHFGYVVSADLPATPRYRNVVFHRVDKEIVILPGGEAGIIVAHGDLIIDDGERKAIDAGIKTLWLWGTISYRDFFNGVATSSFVARHEPSKRAVGVVPSIVGHFRFGGPPEYTRQAYQESDET